MVIDVLFLMLGIALLVLGFIGCVLPILPGPPISFLGILMLHLTSFGDFSLITLILLGVSAIVVTILDYLIPIWGTKKLGGTKWGQWGATIGMIIGLIFLGPIGLILGPFVGAYTGELIGGESDSTALKSALGSLVGFILGTGLKIALSGIIAIFFIKEMWINFVSYWE